MPAGASRRRGPRLAAARVLVALLLAAVAAMPSARADGLPARNDASAVLVDWYELQLDLLRETPGFAPPVAARALGYVGVAAWEAAVPALPQRATLAGQLRALESLPAPEGAIDAGAAVHHALARAVRGLYPGALAVHVDAIDRLEARHARRFEAALGVELAGRSARFGTAVAEAVLAWAASDGGADAHLGGFSGVDPPDGPASWVPTPRPSGPPFPPLHPGWGEVRPMVLPDEGACEAPPPPRYSEEPGSAFHDEALEVYETVRTLDDEQRRIALFWADDPGISATPAGHWLAILNGLVRDTGPPFALAAEAYVRLGIASHDAFVACWRTKYAYDLLRPITYIQRVIDPSWNASGITDPVTTPPFPEYTSGHSVLSGAVAGALSDALGVVAFTDRNEADAREHAERSYASLQEAAREAAISRLYGGIHFRSAIERGLEQGACVAEHVGRLRFRH